MNTFRNAETPTPGDKPKAYLNWILLDEQLQYVPAGSGADPIQDTGFIRALTSGGPVNITKNGFLYIYVSNETQNRDVFFDNLSVQHYTGPITEETHYYPFGSTMTGISSKALNKLYAGNKRGFNGNELQNKEISDESGLEVYDFNARTYDPPIGRFIQIDPETEEGDQESWTSYHFSFNNPILHNDPDGKMPGPVVRALVLGRRIYNAYKIYKTLKDVSKREVALKDLKNEAVKALVENARDIPMVSSAIDVTSGVLNLAVKKEKTEQKEKPVEIGIDANKYPESAQNLQNAIDEGKSNEGVIDRGGTDKRREDNLDGIPTKKGKDRDEAPPAVINTGEKSRVEYINPSDNRGAGGSIRWQIQNLPDGTRVVIVPRNLKKEL